jgi:type VI secretion system (T6SS) baseplate-like injector VgrG
MDDERKAVQRMVLEVGADLWERVATLESSGPHDRHYTSSENEQGRTIVTFGDGVRGARLPSGSQIVTAAYDTHGRYGRVVLQIGRVELDADVPPEEGVRREFFGVYRGRVIDAADPLAKRRLRIEVPEVFGADSVWALPCAPVGEVAVPAAGQTVWILFEKGDPDYPVWVGTLWG